MAIQFVTHIRFLKKIRYLLRLTHHGVNRFEQKLVLNTNATLNPKKSGIGGKSPTFVQNDFTP